MARVRGQEGLCGEMFNTRPETNIFLAPGKMIGDSHTILCGSIISILQMRKLTSESLNNVLEVTQCK